MDTLTKIRKRKYDTKYGKCVILERLSKTRVIVKFTNTGYIRECTISHLERDEVKDYYYPNVCGIGFLGDEYRYIKSKYDKLCSKCRSNWKAMLNRCYNKKEASYRIYGASNVYVCDRWHNFSNFFWDIQQLPGWDKDKYMSGKISIDKDKLQQGSDIKVYSKDTCCFLTPKEQQKYVDYDVKRKEFIPIKPNGKEIFAKGIVTFSRKHNLCAKNVSACLNGKRGRYKGWRFKFIENV